MSQIKTLNGVQYTLPQYNDTAWGANTGNVLTQYLAAIADVTLQLSGGAFTLTANVDFGSSFGIKALFVQSKTANAAAAGVFRLASADTINFRNNANSADISIGKDASDNLQWNATKILLSGAVVNADINAAAAIAYSKLALTGAILNADLAGSIAANKLVAMATSKVVVTDGSGFVTTATPTVTEINYVSGVTSAIQTQLNSAITNPMTSNLTVGAHKITLQPGTNIVSLDASSTTFQLGVNYDVGVIQSNAQSSANINLNTPAAAANVTIGVSPTINTAPTTVATFNNPSTGGVQLSGTTAADNAASGIVGEAITTSWASVALAASGVYKNMGSIVLTAGDWDVFAYGTFGPGGTTTTGPNNLYCGSSSTQADGTAGVNTAYAAGPPSGAGYSSGIGGITVRINVSGSTTVYGAIASTYTGAAATSYGTLLARRRR